MPEGQVIAVDPDTERIKFARETYSCNNLTFPVASDKDFPFHELGLQQQVEVIIPVIMFSLVYSCVFKHYSSVPTQCTHVTHTMLA